MRISTPQGSPEMGMSPSQIPSNQVHIPQKVYDHKNENVKRFTMSHTWNVMNCLSRNCAQTMCDMYTILAEIYYYYSRASLHYDPVEQYIVDSTPEIVILNSHKKPHTSPTSVSHEMSIVCLL